MDLAKAFDTVCHERLLNKLWNYGFRGVSLDLLRSYLTNRQQIVDVGGDRSSSRVVTYGVPQGTVMGPLLFLVYINSLSKCTKEGSIVSFADDTAIHYKADTWYDLKHKVENDFTHIQNWFQVNKLTLNLDKTKFLPFSSYSSEPIGHLEISPEVKIPEAKFIKYLGIMIDVNLKWDQHIEHVVKKLRGLLSKFRYMKKYLNSSTHLIMLFNALVQSQINYGILGWGGVYDVHLRKLNIMQKWIVRIIHGKKITYPSEPLYQKSKILDTRQLYTLKIIISIFKRNIILRGKEHTYTTRNKDKTYQTLRSKKKNRAKILHLSRTAHI